MGCDRQLKESAKRLRASGANEVVFSLAEAVAQLANVLVTISHEMIPAPIPANDEERLTTLGALGSLDNLPAESLDRITARVAHVFEVPIALVNLIDREQQRTASAAGLPENEAARSRSRAPNQFAVTSWPAIRR